MAQGDPPVYQLVDSNGNVQAEIRHDLAQSLIIDQLNGSDIDFQQSDLSNIQSLNTEQVNISSVGEIVEAGRVDHGSVPADGISTVSVSFEESYDDPIVIHSLGDNGGIDESSISAQRISSSGFDSVVNNLTSSSYLLNEAAYLVIDLS